MIEEKTGKNQYVFKDSIIKWRVANELNIIFTVVYKEVLHLKYVDELLDMIKNEFVKKVVPNLDLENGLYITLPTYFDKNFKQIQQKWEMSFNDSKGPKKMRTFNQSKKAKKGNKPDSNPESPSKKNGKSKSEDEGEDEDVEEDNKEESKMTKTELARKQLAEKFKKKKDKSMKKKNEQPKEETKKGKGKEGRFWGYKEKITDEDMKMIDR